MDFLVQYGLFLAKAITIVISILLTIAFSIAISLRSNKADKKGHIEITHLNQKFDDIKLSMEEAVTPDHLLKSLQKIRNKRDKANKKKTKLTSSDENVSRVFVLDFEGDMRASAVESLREAISAVLLIATQDDEVVVRVESAGGLVHSYGLAASQLDRIRQRKIGLTVCVDRVAASGGYMMACVAEKIVAAPFAVIGSIGVMAQLPNFHRLLKKHEIDVELLTAGEFKRTLTMFGENTESGRKKFMEDLDDTHTLFKDYVKAHRPSLDIERIATGEIWFGARALEKKLIDTLMTSDDYIAARSEESGVFQVAYVEKKSIAERMGSIMEGSADRLLLRWLQRSANPGSELTS